MTGDGSTASSYSIGRQQLMTDEYVAGLFYGEGCVHIAKSLTHCAISITQKRPEILYLLQQKYGGKVSKYGKQSCHKWRVFACEDNEKFLNAIYPHVIIKKSEVEIGLKFLANQEKRNLRYNPLTEEQKELRVGCRNGLLEIHGDRYGQLV